MQIPLVMRPLTVGERDTLTAGLRSAEALAVRRCRMLLARAEG
jgi:hypothetical protein